MNKDERKQIQNALKELNPELELEYCPGGCNMIIQYCMCKVMEEAKNRMTFKSQDNTTVNTYKQ